MSDDSKNNLLFSISPEAARELTAMPDFGAMFAQFAGCDLKAMLEGVKRFENIGAMAGLGLLQAIMACADFSPVESRYRIFVISGMVTRQPEAWSAKIETVHYAQLKATGSREQAESSELEYMRGKWPESEGWKHTVALLEVSEEFASGEFGKIVKSGRLEMLNVETAQRVPSLITLGADDETGKWEASFDALASELEN